MPSSGRAQHRSRQRHYVALGAPVLSSSRWFSRAPAWNRVELLHLSQSASVSAIVCDELSSHGDWLRGINMEVWATIIS